MNKITYRDNGSKRISTINNEPSKTDQQWKDDVDVNSILRKFQKTGQLTHFAKVQGQYGDVSNIPDLDQAMQQIVDAKEAFQGLPSAIRARFGNDPSQMLQFLQDTSNDDEAIKLGLKTKPPKPDQKDGPKLDSAVTEGKPNENAKIPTDVGKA